MVTLLGRWCFALACAFSAVGCSHTPTQEFNARAEALGLQRRLVIGAPFQHQIYLNGALIKALEHPATLVGPVHVYLGGDGTPWLTPHTIAPDPTPRQPLALALLAQDPAPALYLGRPCYHGLATTPPCHPLWWTHRRYHPEVVASLTVALERVLRPQGAPPRSLRLFGFSGGGTLAILMAAGLSEVEAIITVAANLDTDAWAALHGYTPLLGSLNPRHHPIALKKRPSQLHLVGACDRRVPALLSYNTLMSRREAAQLWLVARFDHHCCWQRHWRNLLRWVDSNPIPSSPAPLPLLASWQFGPATVARPGLLPPDASGNCSSTLKPLLLR